MEPKTTHLKDYKVPNFLIESIDLTVDIQTGITTVHSQLQIKRNPESSEATAPLELDGKDLKLEAIKINDNQLESNQYQVTPTQLIITETPDQFTLNITVTINPDKNTKLTGLYRSGDMYCTQCESQGFRRITYYMDRPDVMAAFKTKIIADPKQFPVLLANGNLIDQGSEADGRHWTVWQDPFKKPCYLFALIAGDLAKISDTYTTGSGKNVAIEFYVEHGNEDKCSHAIESLKKSMRWDEDTYGREYDLDQYMVVAVSHFNSGAMENKGLNIFNDKYVLAKPELATDQDYINIEAVIGHEYFHNWTGNRITCRDWFQLSLKEGLTVFREQQFSQAMNASETMRIADVEILENSQFPEDAGPMAHPVQPPSYIEINNFYTATVYNKGAEVIRMQHTILGDDGFHKGMDLYFERHDGQAVTIEDFVAAMADANEHDFSDFMPWYKQAGTPEVTLTLDYNAEEKTARIGTQQDRAVHIPIKIALFNPENKQKITELTIDANADNYFVFENIEQKPIVSALRGFSAPIKLNIDYSDSELQFLIAHDDDACARWAASRQLFVKNILQFIQDETLATPIEELIGTYHQVLIDQKTDLSLRAKLIQLPHLNYLTQRLNPIDINALHQARTYLREQLAQGLESVLFEIYEQYHTNESYEFTAEAIAARQLKNTCLDLLLWGNERYQSVALEQFEAADNMTDRMAALQALSHHPGPMRDSALKQFYEQWQGESLVVDKWLSTQATADTDTVIEDVRRLLQHPQFELTKPNRIYALIGGFAMQNTAQFHNASGAGYELLADIILQLNTVNPQVGARMCTPFARWAKFVEPQRGLMEKQLQRMLGTDDLSSNIYEMVSKYLNASVHPQP